MEKRWVVEPFNKEIANHLQDVLKIHPTLCRLLAQRGIETYQQAQHFFRPQLSDLHDPFLMKGMTEAVQRISQALERGERILLYGDYDVDGTTSVATMFTFLGEHTQNLIYYIPDRYKEGYGVSYEGIAFAKENNCSLIIAMDCGIKACEQVEFAKQKGIDFIICDHHTPDVEVPKAVAVLNPMQTDCDYPYKSLSGCGVVFKLIQGICKKHQMSSEHWRNLLDYVVVSIACDIVPITGENRTLAYYGLQKINNAPCAGLELLLRKADRQPPLTISDVVFGLGPIINAAGRLGDAKDAVKVLLCLDKLEAVEVADELKNRNLERRSIEKEMTADAMNQFAEQQGHQQFKSIVLENQTWNKGIVGIVAARLTETFYRPSVVLTKSGENWVGSARSIKGFDLYDALKTCEELFVNFGGHHYAAGLTIAPERLNDFKIKLEEIADEWLEQEDLIPTQRINAPLPLSEVSQSFWKLLKQFGPFGPKNMRPVFGAMSLSDSGRSRVLKDKHLKLYTQSEEYAFSGIGFGLGHKIDIVKRRPFHIAYTLQENHWRGQTTLDLFLKDVK